MAMRSCDQLCSHPAAACALDLSQAAASCPRRDPKFLSEDSTQWIRFVVSDVDDDKPDEDGTPIGEAQQMVAPPLPGPAAPRPKPPA